MKRSTLIIVTLLFPLFFTFGQAGNINDSIDYYFREIKANTDHYKDLWDLDLYGPILLADPDSRKIYANFPDSAGILKKDGNVFTGLLPDKINIANTSVQWNGRSWAMIMFPLPENKQDRLNILSHELFHRSQPSLAFHVPNADNNHLDQRDGRVYLRLELEALRLALIAGTNSETRDHLTNAMFFRKIRYSLFHGASLSENLMELNEGLAEYTGIMMSGRSTGETIKYFEQKLTEFQNLPSFVRSFAYVTTPLYGFILSKSVKDWNKHVTDTTDLTEFFIRNFSLSVPVNLCSECMNQYGSEKILTEEIKREMEKEKQIAAYKSTFIENPHLEIRFEKMNISFDPRNLVPLEGYGTVYPTMRISDNWGILTVSAGALLSKNWDIVTLSEPTLITSDKISGNGWTIALNQGYSVEKNIIDMNFTLKKK